MIIREVSREEIERLTEEYDNARMQRKWSRILGIVFCVIISIGYLYMRIFNTKFETGEWGDSIALKYSTAWIVRYPAEYQGKQIKKIRNTGYDMDDICRYAKILYIEDGIEKIADVKDTYAELHGFSGADFVIVRLPNTIHTIGDYAFDNCGRLKILLFEQAQEETVIGKFAFAGTDLKHIDIPQGVTHIAYGAFCNTSLKKVILPDSLKELGEYVFENCRKLEEVTLSKQLEILPKGTFKDCRKLNQINNTDNLKYILLEALLDTEIQPKSFSEDNLCFAAYESMVYNMDVENSYLSEKMGIPIEVFEEPVDSERIWIDGKYYTMSMSLEEILQNDSWEMKDSERCGIELYNKRTGNSVRVIMDSQGIEELTTSHLANGCKVVLPGGIISHSVGWIRAFMLFDAYEDEYEQGYDIANSYDKMFAGRKYHVSLSINGIYAGSIRVEAVKEE